MRFKGVSRVFHAVTHVYSGPADRQITDSGLELKREGVSCFSRTVFLLPGNFEVSCGLSM